MRVLLLDQGCRAGSARCLHPGASALASRGSDIEVETAAAFACETAGLGDEELGRVREHGRQAIDRAVDVAAPDVILVFHAGMIVDLAIETGVPVAVHVAATDLTAAGGGERIREIIASGLASADALAAADEPTADAIVALGWIDTPIDVFALSDAGRLLATCRRAIDRRAR